MKYLLLLGCMWLLSGCGVKSEEFKELSNAADKEIKTACDKIGGTFASGLELSYTFWGLEVTTGHYCINTKNPTGEIR